VRLPIYAYLYARSGDGAGLRGEFESPEQVGNPHRRCRPVSKPVTPLQVGSVSSPERLTLCSEVASPCRPLLGPSKTLSLGLGAGHTCPHPLHYSRPLELAESRQDMKLELSGGSAEVNPFVQADERDPEGVQFVHQGYKVTQITSETRRRRPAHGRLRRRARRLDRDQQPAPARRRAASRDRASGLPEDRVHPGRVGRTRAAIRRRDPAVVFARITPSSIGHASPPALECCCLESVKTRWQWLRGGGSGRR
jgi:hypothetical protein